MLALVTGASSGIGLQYATALARDYHTDLLLVSNQQEEQIAVAKELAETYHVKATPLYADLSKQDAAEQLFAYCQEHKLEVDILVNNAGVFFFNPLTETGMPRFERMLMLHVVTVAKLTRLFAEQMAGRELTPEQQQERVLGRPRRKGYILNMSSMSAWMAYPGIQTYNATKAFIYNFSKSIWYELYPQGVNVTVMTPGAVDTALFGLAPNLRKLAVNLTVSIPPQKLVVYALRRMFRGKKSGMPGVLNHLATPLLKHTPDWLVRLTYRWVRQFQK